MSSRRDVIDEVVRDHEEIKRLFALVGSTTGDEERNAFHDLVRKLAVHETAEQMVVHPLARGAGADDVRDRRLSEEKEAEKVLDELLEMGPEDSRFPAMFEDLRREVLDHAEREELEEHPKIRAAVDADRLRTLAVAFRAAEASAPTRPHSLGPTSATGNMLVGPVVALMDRARDAIRGALESRRPPTGRTSTATTRRTKSTSKAARVVIDVSPDPRGGWRAVTRGSTRAVARADVKRDVVRRAREVAKARQGRLVVHRQDGRIQEERTYGPDPSRTRG